MHHFLIPFVTVLFAAGAFGAEPVRVSLDPRRAGEKISDDFVGLSYETAQLLPGENGVHYFSPENKPLVAVFKTIGVKSLRIGGNSVDRAETGVPSEADIDSLFAFAKAAGCKVIYSVRLQNGDPASVAKIAKYIHDHYADALDCFAIGNEPSYFKTYDSYRDTWKATMEAMVAVAPGAKFCGPDTNPNPSWCKSLVEDFGKGGPLVMITEHNYPGGCSYKNPKVTDVKDLIPVDPAAAREKLLSGAWYGSYEKIQKGMADAVAGTPLSYRLTETNSLWYGGLAGASDSYASALWSLDYLHWWAAHSAKGLNFHTGDRVGGGDKTLPSRYAAFVTAAGGYDVHPLSYGMKMFELGGDGKMIPVTVGSATVGSGKEPAAKNQDLNVYATLRDEKTMAVTIINTAHGADAAGTQVEIKLASGSVATDAKVMFLAAPHGDIAATTGVTLGGESIRADGSWDGKWTPLKVSGDGDAIAVNVPSASAAVVEVRLR